MLEGINYTDFIAAAMNREKLLSNKKIEKAFMLFDIDGNGVIDLSELKRGMSGVNLTDEEWRNLIAHYDTNGDGVVSDLNFRAFYSNFAVLDQL